jgi:hypothetical protein
MFYKDQMSGFLRMGDVVKGFISAVPEMDEPFTDKNFTDKNFVNYKVTVELPKLLAIITPCCSIGDEKISVAPLEEVGLRKELFEVSYLKDDMTKINRIMEPQKAFKPQRWAALKPEKQLEILNRPVDYQYNELFVYAEHDKLPPYTVKIGQDSVNSRYYMIDFRKTSRVTCKSIISPNTKAFTDEIKQKALDLKILELHPDTRQEFRDKILNYYSRIPDEDQCQMAL